MAQKSPINRADRKAELVSELAWSRAELARNLHDTRNDLDLAARLKQSVAHRKAAWLTGAALTGWVLSRLPGRKKKEPAKASRSDSKESSDRAGMLLTILGVALNVFKPILTKMASRKITEMAARSGGEWGRSLQ
ncbi:MAG: hypothetical protein NTZ46_08260 [Verrucomicrobia bacterium]|nr:hypothetical protein [Verrucomicrobiota bacterium]